MSRQRVFSYLLVASSLAILLFALFQPAQASILQEFPTLTGIAGPYYITWLSGPGEAWFTENTIAKLSKAVKLPVGVVFSEYTIPNAAANVRGIAFDQTRNAIWFTERDANKIGRLDLGTLALTEYDILTPNSQPEQVVVDPTPNHFIWFTESNPAASKVGRLNPDVTPPQITEFTTPTLASQPFGIAVDVSFQNRIWFTEAAANQIAYVDSNTGTIFEFRIPGVSANPGSIVAECRPPIATPRCNADGRVWFVERATSKLGLFGLSGPPSSGYFLEYTPPTAGAGLQNVAIDDGAKVWFTEQSANGFGSLDPFSGQFTEFRVPTAISAPFGISQGSSGEIWVTENSASKIVLFSETNLSGATTMTATASTGTSTSTVTVATSSSTSSTLTVVSRTTTTTSVASALSSFTTPLTVQFSTTTITGSTSTTSTTTTTGTTPTTAAATGSTTSTTTTTVTIAPTTTTTTTETTLTQTLPTSVSTSIMKVTATATRILGNIPGFPVESILAGLALGLAALGLSKRYFGRKIRKK